MNTPISDDDDPSDNFTQFNNETFKIIKESISFNKKLMINLEELSEIMDDKTSASNVDKENNDPEENSENENIDDEENENIDDSEDDIIDDSEGDKENCASFSSPMPKRSSPRQSLQSPRLAPILSMKKEVRSVEKIDVNKLKNSDMFRDVRIKNAKQKLDKLMHEQSIDDLLLISKIRPCKVILKKLENDPNAQELLLAAERNNKKRIKTVFPQNLPMIKEEPTTDSPRRSSSRRTNEVLVKQEPSVSMPNRNKRRTTEPQQITIDGFIKQEKESTESPCKKSKRRSK